MLNFILFMNALLSTHRSSTPNHRSNHNSTANLNLNNARKQDEIETQRGIQYRSRINEIHISQSVLCNGSKWDVLSQKIWNKYELRRQPQELYEKKTVLWQYLCDKIKVIWLFSLLKKLSLGWNHLCIDRHFFFVLFVRLTDNILQIQFIFGRLDDIWICIRHIRY